MYFHFLFHLKINSLVSLENYFLCLTIYNNRIPLFERATGIYNTFFQTNLNRRKQQSIFWNIFCVVNLRRTLRSAGSHVLLLQSLKTWKYRKEWLKKCTYRMFVDRFLENVSLWCRFISLWSLFLQRHPYRTKTKGQLQDRKCIKYILVEPYMVS